MESNCGPSRSGGLAAYHADLQLNKYYGPGTVWVPERPATRRASSIRTCPTTRARGCCTCCATCWATSRSSTAHAPVPRPRTSTRPRPPRYFRDACEAASGRDLTTFFQQWVLRRALSGLSPDLDLRTRRPAASTSRSRSSSAGRGSCSRCPWTCASRPAAARRDFVVPDSLASQAFTLHVDAEPTALATRSRRLDPQAALDRPVVQPPFDRGVLVVNGVDWATYGAEITERLHRPGVLRATTRSTSGTTSTRRRAATRRRCRRRSATVRCRAEVLGHYRNVIWVGNDFNGDVDSWVQTALRSYLDAGGNVFLLAKDGQDFLDPTCSPTWAITLTGTGATIVDCVATRPGLVNLARTGAQSAVRGVRHRAHATGLAAAVEDHERLLAAARHRRRALARRAAPGCAPPAAGSRSCRGVPTAGTMRT